MGYKTLRDVASELGVVPATITYHISRKPDLRESIVTIDFSGITWYFLPRDLVEDLRNVIRRKN